MTTRIDITDGINSLTNFKRHTGSFLRQLQDTGTPVVLTVNGKARLVIQDAASYQQLLDLAERAEAAQAVRESLDAFGRGEGVPALEALESLRQKLGVPRGA
jgi:prevent-host-death family protein